MKSLILVLSGTGLFLFAGCQSQLMRSFASNDSSQMPDPAKVISGESFDDSTRSQFANRGGNRNSLATRLFEGRAKRASASTTELMNRAIAAEHDKQLDNAQALYAEVLKNDPNNTSAHHRLAVIADQRGEFDTAEAHYRAALRNGATDANLLSDIGFSFLMQKKYRRGENALHAALEADPKHRQAIENLGRLYSEQGDYDAAARAFRRYRSPGETDELLSRFFRNGRPRTALASTSNTPDRLGSNSIHAPRPTRDPIHSTNLTANADGAPGPNQLTRELREQMERERMRSLLKRKRQSRTPHMTADAGEALNRYGADPRMNRMPEREAQPADERELYSRRPVQNDPRGNSRYPEAYGAREPLAGRQVRNVAARPNSYLDRRMPPRQSPYEEYRQSGRSVPDSKLSDVMRDIDQNYSGHSSPSGRNGANWRVAEYDTRRPTTNGRDPRDDGIMRRSPINQGMLQPASRTELSSPPAYGRRDEPAGRPSPREGLWPHDGNRPIDSRGPEQRQPIDNTQRQSPTIRATATASSMNAKRLRPIEINPANREALQLGREMGFGEKLFPVPNGKTGNEPSGVRYEDDNGRQSLESRRPIDENDSRFRNADLQRTFDSRSHEGQMRNFPVRGRDRYAADSRIPDDPRYNQPELYRGSAAGGTTMRRYADERGYDRER